MTFEDIPETRSVCPNPSEQYCQFWVVDELETGRYLGHIRSEATLRAVAEHEFCHNYQSIHDPLLAEHTRAGTSQQNINRIYQSLIEAYAELSCKTVGGNDYNKHRTLYKALQSWAGSNNQADNFSNATIGYWESFCSLREAYGAGNMNQLLRDHWGPSIGLDASDNYSYSECLQVGQTGNL